MKCAFKARLDFRNMTAEIVFSEGYLGESVVEIPSEVKSSDGDVYKVVAIDSYAFKNCLKLEEVIIPSSIKDIKTAAFSGCSKLKAIVIPPTVEFLYSHVFQNCKNLEEVVMSCKTHTGDDVFLGCNKATIRLE